MEVWLRRSSRDGEFKHVHDDSRVFKWYFTTSICWLRGDLSGCQKRTQHVPQQEFAKKQWIFPKWKTKVPEQIFQPLMWNCMREHRCSRSPLQSAHDLRALSGWVIVWQGGQSGFGKCPNQTSPSCLGYSFQQIFGKVMWNKSPIFGTSIPSPCQLSDLQSTKGTRSHPLLINLYTSPEIWRVIPGWSPLQTIFLMVIDCYHSEKKTLPSGKLTVCYWKWPFSSLIYPWTMVMFHIVFFN